MHCESVTEMVFRAEIKSSRGSAEGGQEGSYNREMILVIMIDSLQPYGLAVEVALRYF